MTVFKVMSRFYYFTKFFIIDLVEDITNGEAVTFGEVDKVYPLEDRPKVQEALEKQVKKLVAGEGNGCDWVIYCE